MVVSLLGFVELAGGKSALSGEGERTFSQNSNFRSVMLQEVVMGLLMTSKIIKSFGRGFSQVLLVTGILMLWLILMHEPLPNRLEGYGNITHL